MKIKLISFVVPVFNEEEALPIFIQAIEKLFQNQIKNYRYEIVFVNDGSTDQTQQVLNLAFENDDSIVIVEFSRNFGKENALFAGLSEAKGESCGKRLIHGLAYEF